MQERLYQLPLLPWLRELEKQKGRPLTLNEVTGDAWDAIAAIGVDWVWLMGAWQRSERGRRIALHEPNLRRAYGEVLPTWTPEDITGSPYAVASYRLDRLFGPPEGLAAARSALAERGIRLVLDFVPNHTALDYEWIPDHEDRYVTGAIDDLATRPQDFVRLPSGRIVAHGRDPYFPGWTDTLQVDIENPEARRAWIAKFAEVAACCDGLRCDMAMLLLKDVFRTTWGDRVQPRIEEEFWSEIRRAVPDVALIAEAYWNRGEDLTELGFDYSYDKAFYDALDHGDASGLRRQLSAPLHRQARCVRFLENHDEPRAAVRFEGRHEVAALALCTAPGMALVHHGQLEGLRLKRPVQIARTAEDTIDKPRLEVYERLLPLREDRCLREGTFTLLELRSAGDDTHRDLVAYEWAHTSGERRVVIYNPTPRWAQARVPIRVGQGPDAIELRDHMDGQTYVRSRSALRTEGLHVLLDGHRGHLFFLT